MEVRKAENLEEGVLTGEALLRREGGAETLSRIEVQYTLFSIMTYIFTHIPLFDACMYAATDAVAADS